MLVFLIKENLIYYKVWFLEFLYIYERKLIHWNNSRNDFLLIVFTTSDYLLSVLFLSSFSSKVLRFLFLGWSSSFGSGLSCLKVFDLTSYLTSPFKHSQPCSIFYVISSSCTWNSVILKCLLCIPTSDSISKFSIFIDSWQGLCRYKSFSEEAVSVVSFVFHFFNIILSSGWAFYIHGWFRNCWIEGLSFGFLEKINSIKFLNSDDRFSPLTLDQ